MYSSSRFAVGASGTSTYPHPSIFVSPCHSRFLACARSHPPRPSPDRNPLPDKIRAVHCRRSNLNPLPISIYLWPPSSFPHRQPIHLPRSCAPVPAGAVALGDGVEGIAVGPVRQLGSAIADVIRRVIRQQVRLLNALQNLRVDSALLPP